MTGERGDSDPASLIQAIAMREDRAAFAALFKQFAPRVKAYLLRMRLDDGMAEELAQEVLLTVWRKARQFDPTRASPAAWIFTIARNLRIDAARRASLAPSLSDPTDEPSPAAPTPSWQPRTAMPAFARPSPPCRLNRRK